MSSARPTLTLLGKPDCHLCQLMREVVTGVLPRYRARLEERDIRDDPELEKRYLVEIPVLLAGDREVARHTATREQLVERLDALLARPRASSW
jgi:hypothetical protein